MTREDEELMTWAELTIPQRRQVVRWFRNDEITVSPLTVTFIVVDGTVAGATTELD